MEPIKESIALTLDATGIKANSLSGLIAQLKDVETYITSANAALSGLNFTGPARSAKELEAALLKIRNLNTGGGSNFKYAPMVKALGGDDRDLANFERFVARHGKAVDGLVKSQQAFRNMPQFTRMYARFEKQHTLTIGDLLKPGVSKVTGGTVSGGNIKIDGKIDLVVPGAMVNASVSGPISLVIAGSQIQGIMPSGSNAPGSGEFVKGNKAGKKSRGKAPLSIDKQANEIRRVRTETFGPKGGLKEAITVMDETGNLITNVHDSVEQIIKTTTRRTTGATPLAQFRELRAVEQEKFRQLQAGLTGDEFGFGLASVQSKQAAQLRQMVSPALALALGPVGAESVQTKLDAAADTLESKAAATRYAAEQARQLSTNAQIQNALKGRFRQMVGIDLRGGKLASESAQIFQRLFGNTPPPPFNAGTAREEFSGGGYGVPALWQGGALVNRPRPNGRWNKWGANDIKDAEWWDEPKDYIDVESKPVMSKKPKQSKFSKALEDSFSPMGFATHLVKISGWAAAVGVLYKSLQLVEYSMKRVLDVGSQMAHLQVIYTGIGGSVRQLTDDLMKQASVQGRSTDDALESGQEWARILKSRSQVNEAVRVSMMAANISGLPDTETTKQLSSLFHIFHLEVSGLESELSKLVYVSQHYNVTLEDLFRGLDAAAPQARMMGMSLAELSGIIAGTVGKSGQSGTTVGNTIKYILQQFNRPQIQRMLREYGIEPTAASGELKKAPQLMRELFVQYQGLGDTERQSLTTQLAGRFHGSRFTATMDSYIQSQGLAINSQLALNSAQTANAAILDTLQNKLAGLKAEWDRFVFSQANAPSAALGGFTPMNLMTGTVGGLTGGMRSLDQANQSLVTPMVTGAFFGGGALSRHIVGSMLEKEAATTAGSSFMLNLARRFGLGGAMKLLGGDAAAWAFGPEVGLPVTVATFLPALGTMLGSWSGGGSGIDPSQWFRGDAWTKVSGIMGGRASASALKANLFQTTSDLLGIKNPDKVARENIAAAVNLSGTEMSAADGANLGKLFSSGDMAGATAFLGQQGKAAWAQSLEDMKNKAIADKNRVANMNQQIAENQAKLDVPVTWVTKPNAMGLGTSSYQTGGLNDAERKKTTDSIEDEKKALEQLAETASDSQGIIDEVEGMPQDALDRRQEYISLLKQEEEMLTQIGKVAEMGSPGTATDQLNTQIEAAKLQAQTAADYYNGIVQYMKENPSKDVEMAPIRDEALQRMQQYGAQADALDTPERRAAATEETNRNIVLQRAGLEASASAVGYTETAKLINEKKFLTDQIAATRNNPNAGENDLVRAKQMQIDLGTVQQSLDERRIVLLGQQHQIMIDSNREYQKSLLFAGPGELLQKLYVGSRVSRGPISAGEFMSWGTDSRQTYYGMRGGDAGAKNREELMLLKQNAWNEYQNAFKSYQAHPSAAGRAAVTKAWQTYQGAGLATVTGQQGDAAANSAAVAGFGAQLSALEAQALKTTMGIGSMGTATDAVTAALSRLEAKLNSITGGAAPRPSGPAPKSFDISPGHALGAAPPRVSTFNGHAMSMNDVTDGTGGVRPSAPTAPYGSRGNPIMNSGIGESW